MLFLCACSAVELYARLHNKKHLKNVGPIRYCEPLYIVIHQVSLLPPLSHAACASMSTTTTTTRDRGDRYGPIEWANRCNLLPYMHQHPQSKNAEKINRVSHLAGTVGSLLANLSRAFTTWSWTDHNVTFWSCSQPPLLSTSSLTKTTVSASSQVLEKQSIRSHKATVDNTLCPGCTTHDVYFPIVIAEQNLARINTLVYVVALLSLS